MILQALNQYYERKAANPESGIAPEGFEYKELPFIVVINNQGELVQIDDTRTQENKQIRAKQFLVPQSVKRASGIKANLLWDNAEYIFGIAVKGKPERVAEQHAAFIRRVKELNVSDEGITSLVKFLENDPADKLASSSHEQEIKEGNPFLSFRLIEDACLICERNAVVKAIKQTEQVSESRGICLVSGREDDLAILQPSIKGVRGTNTTGGNIVSFNLSAFNSYGKTQGGNAPIGEKVSFSYTTALNHLLSKDSTQKLQVGDATVVFWSDRDSHFESEFKLFLDEIYDDPDAKTNIVKSLLQSVKTGVMPEQDKTTQFFVLGLSPNAARISIRFWHVGTVAEFSNRIAQHFLDLEIDHAPHERDYLSLWWMLSRIAAQNKTENIPPNIAGDWMRTILSGLPYPDALFQAALRRNHAERDVPYARAAVVKSYLNRRSRLNNFKDEKELTVTLDKTNHNAGYRLGRLFAVLERIQEKAQPGINATIRDKYYSSASGTPASVMPILMRMKNHHLSKRELDKYKTYFENIIGEILSELTDFPSQLNLQDQGRFAIGYYHQRQDFYSKTESITTNDQGE